MQCRENPVRRVLEILGVGLIIGNLAWSQTSLPVSTSSAQSIKSATAADLGVAFVKDSTSQIVVERDGKKYTIDLVTHEIREAVPEAEGDAGVSVSSPVVASDPAPVKPEVTSSSTKGIYRPGDDLVFSVPTGRPLDRHGLYLNFTHRFRYHDRIQN